MDVESELKVPEETDASFLILCMAAGSSVSRSRYWHHALSHEAPLQTVALSLTLLHLMQPVQQDRVSVPVTVQAATGRVSLHKPVFAILLCFTICEPKGASRMICI